MDSISRLNLFGRVGSRLAFVQASKWGVKSLLRFARWQRTLHRWFLSLDDIAKVLRAIKSRGRSMSPKIKTDILVENRVIQAFLGEDKPKIELASEAARGS
jgi:hypothetical protein